jgi:hypothetical protein
MEVGVGRAIALEPGRCLGVGADFVDKPLIAEKIEVAIDGAEADVGERFPGFPVDRVGRRVGGFALPEDVENYRALAGIPGFFQRRPPILAFRKVSYFSARKLSRTLNGGRLSYI